MIQMVGTNHRIAPVEVRSMFSMDQVEQKELLEELTAVDSVKGAVVLSTCNRTEVWIDTDEDAEIDLKQIYFSLNRIEREKYDRYFSERSDVSAVQHLFYLASGLRSAILAEDQILAQVKDALDFARENGYTDSRLEVLFRMAVTAAKEVKTNVHFTHVNETAIDRAVRMLYKRGIDLRGTTCLVIGNGKYGKLASTTLRNHGADVYVTVRRYHQGSNQVSVPEGCHMIDYMDRMEYLKDADVIISATSSPHYTINLEDVQDMIGQSRTEETDATGISGSSGRSVPAGAAVLSGAVDLTDPSEFPGLSDMAETQPEQGEIARPILIDLAVPRDVDPRVEELDLFECYNIDDFKTSESELNSDAYEKARQIIDAEMIEFWDWNDTREMVPQIQHVRDHAVTDLNLRLHKIINRLDLPEEDRTKLNGQISSAAGKVLTKILFDLRDYVSPDAYNEVLAGMDKVYDEE